MLLTEQHAELVPEQVMSTVPGNDVPKEISAVTNHTDSLVSVGAEVLSVVLFFLTV